MSEVWQIHARLQLIEMELFVDASSTEKYWEHFMSCMNGIVYHIKSCATSNEAAVRKAKYLLSCSIIFPVDLQFPHPSNPSYIMK